MRVHHPSVAVYVHQIEELSLRDCLLFITQRKYGLIEMAQFFLLVVKQVQVVTAVIAPTANAVYAPVIEYSGASVSSAESLAIHARLAKFLTEVNHHRVGIHASRNNQCR